MARKTVYLGSAIAARVDTRGPARPSWPDVDINGVQLDAGVAASLKDAVALALASSTDWDLARVYFTGGESDPELLIPGRVLFVPQGQRVQRIEPVIPAPSTRLYPGDAINTNNQTPALPAGVVISTGDPLDSNIRNRGAAPITIYKWTGAGFDAGVVVNPGSSLAGAGVSNFNHGRPADYTVDKVWSLADLFFTGLIHQDAGPLETRPVYVSEFAIDMHGNAGDPTQGGGVALYKGPGAGGGRFADMSSKFFGRLAVDAFDSFPVCELGGHPYRPRLAPARYITFGAIAIAATPGAPALPDQPLVTVPLFNVKSVEFLFSNNGAQNVYALLVSPAPADSITGVAGVPDDEAPALGYLTVTPGNEGSLVITDPKHPYGKLLLGANAGGSSLAAGAVLALKRDVIE